MAQGYWVEGENPAVSHAQSIAFDKLEEAILAVHEAKPQEKKLPEPKKGSFERLMSMFNQ